MFLTHLPFIRRPDPGLPAGALQVVRARPEHRRGEQMFQGQEQTTPQPD